MSIACPYCKAVLKTKGLKPGKYMPKCPKCHNPFVIVVPDDENGPIAVQQLVKKKLPEDLPDTVRVPAVKPSSPQPTTDKLPSAASRPPTKIAPPGALTDRLPRSGSVPPPAERTPPPPKKSVSLEDAAAALLEGKEPGEIGEITEPEESPTPDPNATGASAKTEAPPKEES